MKTTSICICDISTVFPYFYWDSKATVSVSLSVLSCLLLDLS